MKPKRVPRLWCALQGLLPLDACLAAQRGELAWPAELVPSSQRLARVAPAPCMLRVSVGRKAKVGP